MTPTPKQRGVKPPGAPRPKVISQQIVSKQRVADHGEVLTGAREVDAMLDLVKPETERIDSRFLEPACGNGNFLAAVLGRKLRTVETRYGKSQLEYERYAVIAVSSIYGIDILQDNVQECRRRLCAAFEEGYVRLFKGNTKARCMDTVRFILERNVVWGDALSFKTVGSHPVPIVLSEWSPVNGSLIKRRDFAFQGLLDYMATTELSLFSDLGEDAFIPMPIREYPVTHYLEVADVAGR